MTLLLICFALNGLSQDPWKNIYSPQAWAERDTWQRSDELIRLLNVKDGDKVADVGCHEGYMTFKMAHEVGQDGAV